MKGELGTTNRINKKVWVLIESDYRSGLMTMKEISEKHGVKVSTIENHFRNHPQERGKDLPVIRAGIAERNKQRLIKAGVTEQTIAEAIARGITEPIKVVFEGKGDQMQATTQPDYQLRLHPNQILHI